MLERLLDDHAELRAVAARLRGYLAADSVPTNPDFPAHIAEGRALLISHVARKETYLRALSVQREDIQARGVPLGGLINAHLRRWPVEEIVRNWASYRIAANGVLDILLEELRFEEAEIFPQMPAVAAQRGDPSRPQVSPRLSCDPVGSA